MITNLKKLFYTGIQYATTKTISDKYIKWLTFANAGMLHKGNIYSMRFAIEHLPSESPVLEIGSFCGLSTNVMIYLMSIYGKKNRMISCDKWIFEGTKNGGNIGNSQISHHDYREFVKSTFMRNVEFFSPNNKPYTIERTSDEFFSLWEKGEMASDVFGRDINLGGKISFCYIDGNHTYEFAKRDFDNVDKYLELGGFVLFDDSSDTDPFGLTRLMKEIMRNRDYELVMKNPNYLFKKVA
ncbi:MAG: class I SAM-dependent methyltransferase [Planktothrix sp.]